MLSQGAPTFSPGISSRFSRSQQRTFENSLSTPIGGFRGKQGTQCTTSYNRYLPVLWKLVLKGCNETLFYEALNRVRIEGRRGKRGLVIVCPHLTLVKINPIVGLRKCLGGQTTPCLRLVKDLSTLVQTRKVRGVPLKRLDIVFPARYQKEVRYAKDGDDRFWHIGGSDASCVNSCFDRSTSSSSSVARVIRSSWFPFNPVFSLHRRSFVNFCFISVDSNSLYTSMGGYMQGQMDCNLKGLRLKVETEGAFANASGRNSTVHQIGSAVLT